MFCSVLPTAKQEMSSRFSDRGGLADHDKRSVSDKASQTCDFGALGVKQQLPNNNNIIIGEFIIIIVYYYLLLSYILYTSSYV